MRLRTDGRETRGPRAHRPRGESEQTVAVGGVSVSHPEKVWWPPRLLPWMANRPLVAERCPDGMRGACFFQKNFASTRLPRLPTVPIRAESTGKLVHYVVGGAKSTLLTLVNLGCIPIHLMNCRSTTLEQPDWLAFDLDPGSGAFADAARAGQLLRSVLEEFHLQGYPKTSGGRGLHVLIPLRRGPSQDEVRAVAQATGRIMAERAPRLVTVAMAKAERGGRVFADALRNAFGQTIVAPYAVRRRPRAPVSTPLEWDEVDPKLDPATFNIRSLARRFGRTDPWGHFWKNRQRLPDLPS